MELVSIAKAIIVGVGVLGPALGISFIFAKGLEGISRNPEAESKMKTYIYVGAGMVEVFGLASIVLFFLIK